MNIKKALITVGLILLGYFIVELIRYPQHIEQVSQSGEFTDAFKTGFILSCKADGATEEQCKCAVNYYEAKYTYGEYLEVANDETVLAEMREQCE